MPRTRDPRIDDRILDGAVEVYAAGGWAGFTFENVAKAADVGKPAVYLRWGSREELLFAAIDLQMPAHALPDTGSIRGDLIGMADEVLDGFITGPGAAVSRLELEVKIYPVPLAELHERLALRRRAMSRTVVRRAIQRGELRPDTPIIPLIDLVVGAVINHWRSALPSESAKVSATRKTYIETVVDAALSSFLAAGADQPAQVSQRR